MFNMKLHNFYFIAVSLFWEFLRICNADGGDNWGYQEGESFLDGGDNWGYHEGESFLGPEHWEQIPGSSCAGRRQSPIDIKTNRVSFMPSLRPVIIEQLQTDSGNVELHKGTTTLKLDFTNKWKISFGKDGCLKPFSIHWHWGSDNSKGSEHALNGEKFPLEGHLATYNCNLYKTAEEAVKGPSGLYVIGFFYEIGENNEAVERILMNIPKLKSEHSVSIPEINPIDFLPRNLAEYYRYEGSLTFPACTENVIWTVMADKLTIGKSQMEIFRNLDYGLPEHGKMVDNFRPIIEIESSSDFIERIVYSSFKKNNKRNI